jgi:large subunit ribosomal protein L16
MALQPRKQKYRKAFRGKMRGKASRGNQLNFGEYGLKATGRGWLTAQQIEAARRSITHHTKRQAKVWIRVFSDKPVTAKPAGAGMGGGKGSVDKYVVVVKPGRILFEVSGVDRKVAKE